MVDSIQNTNIKNQETRYTKKTNKKPIYKKIILIICVIMIIVAAIVIVVRSSCKKEEYRLIKVKGFDGSVTLERESFGTMDAVVGMNLKSEDVVEVGKDAFLELLADNDKHIGAKEQTGFILHSSGNAQKGSITIELLYGEALFTIDNKLGSNSSFDVNTPNATLSVRGTTFNVSYDKNKRETIANVIEGTVWVEAHGEEYVLQPGDIIIINDDEVKMTADDEEGMLLDDDSEYMEEARLMIRFNRVYQNVPDYATAEPLRIELRIENEISDEDAEISIYDEEISGKLAECAILFDQNYIEPVMGKVNLILEEEKYDIVEKRSRGETIEFLDVTDWFIDNGINEITINGDDYSFTFEVTKVKMGWDISIGLPEANADDNSSKHYIVYYEGNDGTHYSIYGVSFSFEGVLK